MYDISSPCPPETMNKRHETDILLQRFNADRLAEDFKTQGRDQHSLHG